MSGSEQAIIGQSGFMRPVVIDAREVGKLTAAYPNNSQLRITTHGAGLFASSFLRFHGSNMSHCHGLSGEASSYGTSVAGASFLAGETALLSMDRIDPSTGDFIYRTNEFGGTQRYMECRLAARYASSGRRPRFNLGRGRKSGLLIAAPIADH